MACFELRIFHAVLQSTELVLFTHFYVMSTNNTDNTELWDKGGKEIMVRKG